MDMHRQKIALGIGDDMTLAALIRLAGSRPRGPPLCVVATLWLSMIPTEGEPLRPLMVRASVTNWSTIRCQTRSSRHR
jgi:hypothetical protein